MRSRRSQPAALTLIEVLIVVAVIGVMGAMLVASSSSNSTTQLQAAATILGRDIDYARSLAVANGDAYKITFDVANNRWTLTHSGTNYALDSLPRTPLHLPTDPATQQITDLTQIPALGTSVRLHAVWTLTASPQAVSDVEFKSLGNTTRGEATVVWFVAGRGANQRYIAVRVNPVTGLYWVENYTATVPTAAVYAS